MASVWCIFGSNMIQRISQLFFHAPGALDSWEKETAKLCERKATEIEGFLITLFDAWNDNDRLNSRWAEPEGDLSKGKKFFAIKRIPIRAYFWYSDVYKKYNCYQSLCL